MPVKIEPRYEYNCAQWVQLPGPDEDMVEDPFEELEAARFFDDPVATAGARLATHLARNMHAPIEYILTLYIETVLYSSFQLNGMQFEEMHLRQVPSASLLQLGVPSEDSAQRQTLSRAAALATYAAALKTPNARQNVVTVRRRDDLGRGSALISPECIRSKKRLRMEVRRPPHWCHAPAA